MPAFSLSGFVMEFVTIIGIFASVCSMVSFLPQALKIVKTRDTSALSAKMYAITVAGFTGWSAFGILKQEWPLIVTNIFCLVLSAFILLMKVLPQRHKDRLCDLLTFKQA